MQEREEEMAQDKLKNLTNKIRRQIRSVKLTQDDIPTQDLRLYLQGSLRFYPEQKPYNQYIGRLLTKRYQIIAAKKQLEIAVKKQSKIAAKSQREEQLPLKEQKISEQGWVSSFSIWLGLSQMEHKLSTKFKIRKQQNYSNNYSWLSSQEQDSSFSQQHTYESDDENTFENSKTNSLTKKTT